MKWNLRYAKDKEEKGGGKFKPPASVQSAAKHALKLIEEGKAGDGFTSVGRHRAHQLAAGEMVPLSDIKRMHSYFSRHGVDKKGKDWNNDSPGKVAWLAWGGDAGASWAASIVKKHGGGDNKKEAARYRDEKCLVCRLRNRQKDSQFCGPECLSEYAFTREFGPEGWHETRYPGPPEPRREPEEL